jgi:hypothetical protein
LPDPFGGYYALSLGAVELNGVPSDTIFSTVIMQPIAPTHTTYGTPFTWYIDRGITSDFETYDTTDFNDDGYTGRQKFLMNVDDLFDDADYFKNIGLSLTNGNPAIVIPHSKTDRRYSVHTTPHLSPADWTSPTNSLGTGGTLTLEVPDEPSPSRFFKATVELP